MEIKGKPFKEFSLEFNQASNRGKFLEKFSDYLKTEYGVEPTSKGRGAIKALFDCWIRVARPSVEKKATFTASEIVVSKIVENWSKPTRTLN